MANRKVTLVRNCKTADGWRRYPAAFGRNGRIKPDVVIVGDKEHKYPEGVYQLRTYEGSRMVYKPVGDNAQDAVAAQQRESALLAAREHATIAGAKIVEEPGRKYIRRVVEAYKLDRENRGAREAWEQARLVGDEFIVECGLTFIDEVTPDAIYRFHKALNKRGCGPRTIANKHARLKSILLFGGVPRSVIPPTPKFEKALPTIYTTDDVKAIRAAADPYMQLVIDLALKAGLREQEVSFATWPDIDLHAKVIRVRGKKLTDVYSADVVKRIKDERKRRAEENGNQPDLEWAFKVKDSEQREVPLPDSLLTALKEWREGHKGSRLIVPNEDGEPEGHLLRKLKQVARRADLNCGECPGCHNQTSECGEWTLHKFRRTFATTLLRNGVDLRTVQHWMGHSDIASTMRYLRPASTDEARAAVNAIW